MPQKKKEEIVDAEFVESAHENKIAKYARPNEELALTPAFSLDTAKHRMKELQDYVQAYLKEGEDFGTIPGTPKPTLYKSGADKLCDIYGMADSYRITNRVEDWDKHLFDFEVECTLTSKRTGQLIATGLGSCSSYETKYRYRELKRTCPKCGKPTIIKGREDYGGGWLCWKKDGRSDGCGAKFGDNDTSITSQVVGRIQNEDVADQKNTLLKMAKKRAKIDAVLSATRSSGLFTQDIEDWDIATARAETPELVRQAELAEKQPVPSKATPVVGKPVAPAKGESDKPAGPPPPKAEIPTLNIPTGTKPVEAKPSDRMKGIALNTGTSTTNLMAFMAAHFSVAVDDLGTVKAEIPGLLTALEQTISKFNGKEVAPLIMGSETNQSVKTYFVMAYAKTQTNAKAQNG